MSLSGKRIVGAFVVRPFWQVQAFWSLIFVGLCAWFASVTWRLGGIWGYTDPMAFSGFLAVILGIGYSVLVDIDHVALLRRWHMAGIIDLDPAIEAGLITKATALSIVLQAVSATVIVVAMYLGYREVSGVLESGSFNAEFYTASMVCAALVGLRLGRLASHGMLGRLLRKARVPLWLTAGHPDHTGGLARIGRFYLLQAFVVMALIVWLVAWLVISQLGYRPGYEVWTSHFLTLLVIAMSIFALAFLLPMVSIRTLVVDWKRHNIDPELTVIRVELAKVRRARQLGEDQRRKERELVTEVERLMSLPSWPIGRSTRGVFVTSILIPLGINIVVAVLSP